MFTLRYQTPEVALLTLENGILYIFIQHFQKMVQQMIRYRLLKMLTLGSANGKTLTLEPNCSDVVFQLAPRAL
jgi:hypothetical protein